LFFRKKDFWMRRKKRKNWRKKIKGKI
jgi:hypothetical protein